MMTPNSQNLYIPILTTEQETKSISETETETTAVASVTTLSAFSTSTSSSLTSQSSSVFKPSANSLDSKMSYLNITKLLNSSVSEDEVREFIKYIARYKKVHSNNPNNYGDEELECKDYCKGELYQWLRAYNGVHGYVALMICIFGTIANILNIMVLTKKDMAKAPINKILKWLAVVDCFVMVEYIPFASYQYIYMKPGENDFSHEWAIYILFHMHFTQILHTISIGLTVTLAIWRYVAIRHPHANCASYLLSHCNEAILQCFIISPIVCFPTFYVFKIGQKYDADTLEILYYVEANRRTKLFRINFWIHSVIIKLLPCCILTIISCILVRVLCEASKRRQKLKDYNHTSKELQFNEQGNMLQRPLRCDRRTDRTTMLLVAVLILFLVTEFPQGILGLLSGVLEKCFFNACYPPFGALMDLLALINAAVGFVLYGLMSKQFRTTFKSLFFKRRFGSIEMTRLTRATTTCV